MSFTATPESSAKRDGVTSRSAIHGTQWRAYEQLEEELLLVKRRLYIAKAERVDTTQLELEFAELSTKLDALDGALPEEDEGDDEQTPRRRPASALRARGDRRGRCAPASGAGRSRLGPPGAARLHGAASGRCGCRGR